MLPAGSDTYVRFLRVSTANQAMFAEAARSQDREGELDEREIAAGLGSWLHPAGKATAATEEEANTLAGELRREWANEAIVATVPAEIPPAENIHEDPQEGR